MKNNEIPLLPDKRYHIYNHANGSENLFSNRNNKLFFLEKYALHIEPIAKTIAYCLMPNHIHFAIEMRDIEAIRKAYYQKKSGSPEFTEIDFQVKEAATFASRSFGNLFSSYSQALNKQNRRMGSLFIPNFKRKEVKNETHMRNLVYYIHSNPVHHGFTKEMMDWEFSSIHSYKSEKLTRIAKTEGIRFFEGMDNFISQHTKASPFLTEFEF